MESGLKLLLQVLSASLILMLGVTILNNITSIDNTDLIQAYHLLLEQEKNVSSLLITTI